MTEGRVCVCDSPDFFFFFVLHFSLHLLSELSSTHLSNLLLKSFLLFFQNPVQNSGAGIIHTATGMHLGVTPQAVHHPPAYLCVPKSFPSVQLESEIPCQLGASFLWPFLVLSLSSYVEQQLFFCFFFSNHLVATVFFFSKWKHHHSSVHSQNRYPFPSFFLSFCAQKMLLIVHFRGTWRWWIFRHPETNQLLSVNLLDNLWSNCAPLRGGGGGGGVFWGFFWLRVLPLLPIQSFLCCILGPMRGGGGGHGVCWCFIWLSALPL